MKCYNCGSDLSESNFCNACGADVGLYKRIIYLSNRYYNEGLEKAQVRDLSGAKECLRLSLKCNKFNTEARNLLGLVCFEMGDAVDGLSEWVLSTSYQPKKNIAADFLDSIQNNQAKWDTVRQTIAKYNKALEYCRQDSRDMAIIQLKSLLKLNPNMVKGHQLLALLYIDSEEWDKAERSLARAKRIDTNNTTTLLYERAVEEAINHRDETDPEAAKHRKKKTSKDVIEYTSGNETIIQPINNTEHSVAATTALNIAIGLVIGLAIMWYLVLPARVKSAQSNANDSVVEVSTQLTEKNAKIDELQKRVDALEQDNSELISKMEGLTGSDSAVGAAETLMKAAAGYIQNPDDLSGVAQEVIDIDPEFVEGEDTSEAFKTLYALLRESACRRASEEYLEKGLASLKADDYPAAIEQLSKSFELDNNNAEALYNLGHAYRRADEMGRAEQTYSQVITMFPDTEYADGAKEYVNGADAVEGATADEGQAQ
ncbi:MAG: tetratricopeptide repeat protein [Lachnospiraceae bacterium]|nr:tetratricopeptide repeat protein [Lachnospiraceae bacterium]